MSAEARARQRPEPAAVNSRWVLLAIFGAFVLMFAAIFVFKAIYDAAVPVKTLPAPQSFPEPRVDTTDAALLHRLIAEQRQRLETWRWADAEHTLVQIPIERAMRIVVEKGAAAYEPLLAPQPSLSSPQAGAERVITPAAGSAATAPADRGAGAAAGAPSPGIKPSATAPSAGPASPQGSVDNANVPAGAPRHGSDP